jgi:4-carboxymuconolactone decarboxylase
MTNWKPQRVAAADPQSYDAQQREIHDAIASGPRGGVRGPLAIWLRRPELAASAQALGRYCRYDTLLDPRLSELAILTIAQIWKAEYEWYAHKPAGLKAGLSPDIIEAIRTGQEPVFDRTDEQIVFVFSRAAHLHRTVPDALFKQAVDILGEDVVIDLVGLLGYYSLISLTINIFNVSPPEGAPRELTEEDPS